MYLLKQIHTLIIKVRKSHMKKSRIIFPIAALCFPLFLSACNFDNGEEPKQEKPTPAEPTPGEEEQKPTPSGEDDNPSGGGEGEDQQGGEEENPPEPEIPVVEMNKKQALQTLSSSPYSSSFKCTEDIGLSDAKSVGIDEKKLTSEELYPVAEKTSEVHVYSASEIGLEEHGLNNAGALSIFIESIKNIEGIKIIELDDVIYDINSTISFAGIDNLYIVGKEHTMFFSGSWGTYLHATSCKNLHLNNIQFDMKYSPTISGEIVAVDEQESYADVTIKVPGEFDLSYAGYRNFDSSNSSSGQCSYMECFLDPVTNKYVPDPNHNLFYNSATSFNNPGVLSLAFNGDRLTIRLSKSFAYCSYRTPVMGAHVSFAFTMYQNHALGFDNCEGLRIENTNVYTCGGMGIHIGGGKDIGLNRMNFRNKEGSSRIMTCTADIIHSVSVEGDLKVTNCILEASHDDALNIKTWYCNVSDASKISSKYTITQSGQSPDNKFDVGDVIELYDKKTLARIKSFEIIELEKNGSNYEVKVKGINGAKVDPEDTKFLLGNDTKATHLYLHNCLIQNKRNRGILLQARHCEISNCCFRNIIHGPIQILGVRDIFGEAILPDHVVVKNNKFTKIALLVCGILVVTGGVFQFFVGETTLRTFVNVESGSLEYLEYMREMLKETGGSYYTGALGIVNAILAILSGLAIGAAPFLPEKKLAK